HPPLPLTPVPYTPLFRSGRRLGITGPIESADIGGIATMDSFARGLLPHLDVSPGPPAELGTAAARGGVYDWSERDADALRAARIDRKSTRLNSSHQIISY